MSEMRLDPPTSAPSPLPPLPAGAEPYRGSLALGVGLAWLIMIGGEILLVMLMSGLRMGLLGALWLPPLAIVVTGVVMLRGDHARTGKGMLLGLLSIIAVLLLLVAACFGLMSGINH